ncbi:MAG: hypothetical protein IJV26_10370 [Lachnospiraceae bacterium]|nr:hypothetical protein [Lachnospiraceae bacterium]
MKKKDRCQVNKGKRCGAALLLAAVVMSGSLLLSDICVTASPSPDQAEAAAAAGQTAGEAAEAERIYPEKEHTELDYSELEFTGYDDTRLKEAITELDALCDEDTALAVDRVIELYHVIEEEFNILQTQIVLCEIRTKMDVTDQEMQKAQLDLDNEASVLSDEAGRVLKRVLDSQYRDEFVYEIGEEAAEVLDNYTPMEQWYLDLTGQEMTLVQQYYEKLDEDELVTINGEEWTLASFYDNPPEDETEYLAVQEILYHNVNNKVLPILQELIGVRNELAVKSGYKNYAEYAYDVEYGRDYGEEELKKLYVETKKKIVPLQNRLSVYSYYRGYEEQLNEYVPPEGEALLDLIEPQIGAVDERLLESFHYLREHHHYDIEKRPGKADSGFTVPLTQYGTAFIFISPSGTIDDVHTMIHEFGHYNAAFHNREPAIVSMSSVDVAEIQSQGLELLTAEHAVEMLGEKTGKAYRADRVTSMLQTVIEGCYFDELQWKLYEEPEMTAEEINRLAMELGKEYGFYFPPGTDAYYAWVMVQHTFEQPMYYISYAVSALSSLDIASRAETDRDSAVDLYMRLSAINPNLPYRDVVSELGLTDIFAEGGIATICDPITKMLGFGSSEKAEPDEGELPGRLTPAEQRLLEKHVLYGIAAAAALLLIFCICLNVIRRRKLRAAREEAQRLAEERARAEQEQMMQQEQLQQETEPQEQEPQEQQELAQQEQTIQGQTIQEQEQRDENTTL